MIWYQGSYLGGGGTRILWLQYKGLVIKRLTMGVGGQKLFKIVSCHLSFKDDPLIKFDEFKFIS